MAKRVYDDEMKLDMPFAEAMERFARVNPKEMQANIKRAKKKKPSGGKKPSKGTRQAAKAENVVELRQRRMRKRNYGR
ncbi:MAG: hypothetical protein K8F62_04375 [Pseudorhodoplanes sp.]|nr:hypothetical protein [Pseudorhodoplanes sp.]